MLSFLWIPVSVSPSLPWVVNSTEWAIFKVTNFIGQISWSFFHLWVHCNIYIFAYFFLWVFMLLSCSSSTCHGFFSAYIIAHSLTLLVVKLFWDHITLFLHRSPNPIPYCTSLSPFSILIPFLLYFMILYSLCFPFLPPHQVLLPSSSECLLLLYFSIGLE